MPVESQALRCSDMRKIIGIVAINTLYGAMLGGFTAAATVPFAAAFGPMVGCVIGLMTSPVVAICVHRKPLLPAFTIVYVLTLFVTGLAIPAKLSGFLMLVSALTLCLSSICVRVFLADAPGRQMGVCDDCGYNLTGNVSGICSECGTPIPVSSPAQELVSDASKYRFLGLVLSLATVTVLLVLIARQKVAAMRPAKDVNGLIRQLADNEALVHDPAINELVRRGKEPLLKALKHSNPTVRRHAVKGLLRLGDSTTVADLVQALDDSDPWARMWAARALGNLGEPEAICPLLKLRYDPKQFVQRNVMKALESLGVDPQAEPSVFGCMAEDAGSGM